jgi:hypothetical protein
VPKLASKKAVLAITNLLDPELALDKSIIPEIFPLDETVSATADEVGDPTMILDPVPVTVQGTLVETAVVFKIVYKLLAVVKSSG